MAVRSTGDARAAIHEVAQEHDLAAVAVPKHGTLVSRVSELGEERLKFVLAAVHVADHVERAVVELAVVPERLARDFRRVHVLHRLELEDVPEPLALKGAERAVQLLHLLSDDVRAEVAILARLVPLVADPFGDVEHHRNRQDVELAREGDGVFAGLGLHVRGVEDRKPASSEALLRDVIQHVEGVGRGRLVVLVIGHEAPALVG